MEIVQLCSSYYGALQADLQHYHPHNAAPALQMEQLFKICLQYWSRLKKELFVLSFYDAEEEITFFRDWKPRFKSLIEYYKLLYQCELFRPGYNGQEYARFWQDEMERIKKFRRRHHAFISYYKSGRTNMDPVYFLRTDRLYSGRRGNTLMENELTTTHDGLVTLLLTYELYASHIQQQLAKV